MIQTTDPLLCSFGAKTSTSGWVDASVGYGFPNVVL